MPRLFRLLAARRAQFLTLSSCLAGASLARTVRAQDDRVSLRGGASAIALLTHDTGAPGGRTLDEGYLTQPTVAALFDASWFHALGTLDLEGLTLRRGELDLGEWGEGYIDRRHPHAYVHELMLGAESETPGTGLSLYAGRGFVSFGSDDPMVRPFVSYPVDHHLAQILERVVVVGATRAGPFVAEASTFNGDEPLDPATPPRFRRFGDSWSVRGTILGDRLARLAHGAELSASYAAVKSPEYREGEGLDQRKAHVSLRLTGALGPFSRYMLVEAARTTDLDHARPLYTFRAFLAEGALCRNEVGAGLRWERSDRPEEERELDLFRAPRPATDVSILGVTQWTTLTAAAVLPGLRGGTLYASPFVEAARLTVNRTTAALFDPARFYGTTTMWRVSIGLRVGTGHRHERMGRYGAALPPMPADEMNAAHGRASPSYRCFT